MSLKIQMLPSAGGLARVMRLTRSSYSCPFWYVKPSIPEKERGKVSLPTVTFKHSIGCSRLESPQSYVTVVWAATSIVTVSTLSFFSSLIQPERIPIDIMESKTIPKYFLSLFISLIFSNFLNAEYIEILRLILHIVVCDKYSAPWQHS